MSIAQTTVGVALLSIVGAAAVNPLLPDITPRPPIDVIGAGYDAGEENPFWLRREVVADKITRAGYFIEFIDDGTERAIDPCTREGFADFKPDEPTFQRFPVTPECRAALPFDVALSINVTLSPLGNPAGSEVFRTDVFKIERAER